MQKNSLMQQKEYVAHNNGYTKKAENFSLSILIPVYNGEIYIGSLLDQITDLIQIYSYKDIEVVVANNLSTDNTLEIAKSYLGKIDTLTVAEFNSHVHSAEENVFRAFDACKGEYVWTLGVDDIINLQAFPQAYSLIKSSSFDFIQFNCPTVSEYMSVRRNNNFMMTEDILVTDMVNFVQRWGFWYVIAGMSGQIMRTSMIKDYDLPGLVEKTSKIYSHVAAYLEAFHDKIFCVANTALIYYKVTHRDDDHWVKAAKNIDVFNEYFWTLGFIKLIKYLSDQKIIPEKYIGNMIDTNEFFFFRPVHVVADKLRNQLKIMGGTTDLRNHVKPEEFYEITNFISTESPFLREFSFEAIDIFEKLIANLPVFPDSWDRLDRLRETSAAEFIASEFLVKTVGPYEIYKIANEYYAVHFEKRSLLYLALRYIDSDVCEPFILRAPSFERIVTDVRAKLQSCKEVWEHTGALPVPVYFREAAGAMATSAPPAGASLQEWKNRAIAAETSYQAIRTSTMWRATAPIRWVLTKLKGL